MNLRHLRAFAAIADFGGFARAAPALHLSQPALSRQIHALEAQLGMPLFDRVGRGVRLTSEGEDLLRRSRRLLAEVEALGERARSLKTGAAGILRVGATPQVMENLLAKFIARHRRRHAGIEVHLVEEGGHRMAERLACGDVHLACMAGGDNRFHARLLAPIHVVAVLPKGHRLGARAVLEIAELADEPLLVLRREFGSRAWFDAACQVARINPPVLLESGVPQTLVALAATHYGIAILPSNAHLPPAGVRAVPLIYRGASIGRWQAIAWDPQRFLAPYAVQFIDELVASARLDYPGRHLIRRAPPLPKPKEAAAPSK
jgi:LysR family transcriptional regulator, cyn operon transcriptional activator